MLVAAHFLCMCVFVFADLGASYLCICARGLCFAFYTCASDYILFYVIWLMA